MPHAATFRFYATLRDFLAAKGGADVALAVDATASVKDLIEALGVPHPEVDLVLANGTSVAFGYHVQPGDRISIYPRFHSIDIADVSLVRPAPLAEPRFVLDTHLGRLASYLRLAGFDAVYGHEWDDAALAEASERESRILLTRDVALLKRGAVAHGCYVRETNPRRQFAEVVERHGLAAAVRPFTRCPRCNGAIAPVSKAMVLDRLPPRTREHYDEFWRCTGCGRVYWKGSHYERLREWLGPGLS